MQLYFLFLLFFILTPFVLGDHVGPEKIVDGKYVVVLSINPIDEGMSLRFFFRDIRSGKTLPQNFSQMITIKDSDTAAVLVKNETVEVVRGVSEYIYAFPKSGLYKVQISFELDNGSGVVYTPDSWGLWMPGENGKRSYPFGFTEFSGFFLLFLLLCVFFYSYIKVKRKK